jgi:predicted AlkP superfamily pyrophosphatase or phosphodiesterase
VSRLIFVLLDGLRFDVADGVMGYMRAQAEAACRRCIPVTAELPSLSRPLYETLMTGVPPVRSLITGNRVVRRSLHPSVFDQCRRAGKVTAAAAYHWFSELYNQAPFERTHRITHDPNAAIQHGMFYWRDPYPDDHLFADAEALRTQHDPHFLLVHSMGIDYAGHRDGGASTAYRTAAREADALLSAYLPSWLTHGYTVIVTSDHGMSDDGSHSGPNPDETMVPFWLFGGGRMPAEITLRQTEIAGTVCALMGVPHAGMTVNEDLL